MKIVSKNSTRTYNRDGIKSYLLISNLTTGSKQLTTTLVEMNPGGLQRLHSHEQEQCYFILEGHGQMTVGEEVEIVKAGDCIFIPSNEKHGLKNTGSQNLKYFSAASPSWDNDELTQLWPD